MSALQQRYSAEFAAVRRMRAPRVRLSSLIVWIPYDRTTSDHLLYGSRS